MTAPARRGSLTIVGTGIAVAVHTTLDAMTRMRRAERLLYLVTDPTSAAWIRRVNPAAESLDDAYAEGKPRQQIYKEMTARILDAVRSGADVCAAFYGHPGVFVNASHAAIRRARREGFPARMLPGISAEDCLFADLGVNPGDAGCQSFEATDFLGSRRRFDPTSALILWQVGVIGESSVRMGRPPRRDRLQVLTHTLSRHYGMRHRVVLYEAAQFPVCDPVIQRISLARLPATRVMPLTTLYVPPKPSRDTTRTVTRWPER